MSDEESEIFFSRTSLIIKKAREVLQEKNTDEFAEENATEVVNEEGNQGFTSDYDIFSGDSSEDYIPPTDSGSEEEDPPVLHSKKKNRLMQREIQIGGVAANTDQEEIFSNDKVILGATSNQNVFTGGELIPNILHDNHNLNDNDENIIITDHIQVSNEPKLRKVRTPSLWKRNLQRTKRLKGEEYKTQKGKTVPGRPMKVPPCVNKINHKCSVLVPEITRAEIYDKFHSLKDLHSQREFILRHVKVNDKARQTTTGPSRRKSTKIYSFTSDGKEQIVCREFFLDTLNISEGIIRGAFNKVSSTGILEPEKRGKKEPPHKVKAEDEEFIKKHILSFPALESHYCRKASDFKYLDSNLNIRTMFKMYELECTKLGKKACGFEKYRLIFRSYKLEFHKPKKDLCKRCVKYEGLTGKEKDAMETYQILHLVKKESARRLREEDKEAAKADKSILAINFDLQAVLNTPKGAAGPLFYVRKLAVYNLCIFNLDTHAGHCYVWDETEGKRGSIEISTSVYKFLMASSGVREVRMMSDSCGGQQKNHNFLFMCIKVLQDHPTISKIDYRFFEPGHSQMECDSLHSKIEVKAKNLPVYTTEGWTQVIRLARSKPKPFEVTTLTHDEFIDFHSSKLTFHSTETGEPLRFQDTVWFQFNKESSNTVHTKTEYDSEKFTKYEIKLKRGRPALPQTVTPYKNILKISKVKHDDLLKLCDELIIPKAYHEFYFNLPSASDVRDKLPEPDILEESEEEPDY